MLYYFRKYPVSLIIVAIIFYLSFFTPPKTDMEEIPYIDKVVHICMYGGLCFILWIEYLRNHKTVNWNHVIWGNCRETGTSVGNSEKPYLFHSSEVAE